MSAIEKPWIIVHQLPTGKLETMLAGPPGADEQQFALIICDIARHVAKAFGVSESRVWYLVKQERDDPTTDIARTLQS